MISPSSDSRPDRLIKKFGTPKLPRMVREGELSFRDARSHPRPQPPPTGFASGRLAKAGRARCGGRTSSHARVCAPASSSGIHIGPWSNTQAEIEPSNHGGRLLPHRAGRRRAATLPESAVKPTGNRRSVMLTQSADAECPSTTRTAEIDQGPSRHLRNTFETTRNGITSPSPSSGLTE